METSIELTAVAEDCMSMKPRLNPIRLPRAKTIKRKVDVALRAEYRAHRRMIKQQVKDNLRAELIRLRKCILANSKVRLYNLIYVVPETMHDDARGYLVAILKDRLYRLGYSIKSDYHSIDCSFEVSWQYLDQ